MRPLLRLRGPDSCLSQLRLSTTHLYLVLREVLLHLPFVFSAVETSVIISHSPVSYCNILLVYFTLHKTAAPEKSYKLYTCIYTPETPCNVVLLHIYSLISRTIYCIYTRLLFHLYFHSCTHRKEIKKHCKATTTYF